MEPYRSYMISKYNFAYYPTVYFDGGQDIYIGGEDREFIYEDIIENSGVQPVHDLDLTVSMEWLGGAQIRISVSATNNEFENYPPAIPSIPSGPALGNPGVSYEFTSLGTDPNRQQVYYMWDWGNGETTEWLGPYEYNQTGSGSYSWAVPGTFEVKVKIKDTYDLESSWSAVKTVDIWKCGDINDDDAINILDIVGLINYKYKSGVAPVPEFSADVNNDEMVNILDIVALINYKYKSGAAPDCPND